MSLKRYFFIFLFPIFVSCTNKTVLKTGPYVFEVLQNDILIKNNEDLDLGKLSIHRLRDLEFTIRNISKQEITIKDIKIDNGVMFALSTNNMRRLSGSDDDKFKLSLKPKTIGENYKTKITILTDSPDQPVHSFSVNILLACDPYEKLGDKGSCECEDGAINPGLGCNQCPEDDSYTKYIKKIEGDKTICQKSCANGALDYLEDGSGCEICPTINDVQYATNPANNNLCEPVDCVKDDKVYETYDEIILVGNEYQCRTFCVYDDKHLDQMEQTECSRCPIPNDVRYEITYHEEMDICIPTCNNGAVNNIPVVNTDTMELNHVAYKTFDKSTACTKCEVPEEKYLKRAYNPAGEDDDTIETCPLSCQYEGTYPACEECPTPPNSDLEYVSINSGENCDLRCKESNVETIFAHNSESGEKIPLNDGYGNFEISQCISCDPSSPHDGLITETLTTSIDTDNTKINLMVIFDNSGSMSDEAEKTKKNLTSLLVGLNKTFSKENTRYLVAGAKVHGSNETVLNFGRRTLNSLEDSSKRISAGLNIVNGDSIKSYFNDKVIYYNDNDSGCSSSQTIECIQKEDWPEVYWHYFDVQSNDKLVKTLNIYGVEHPFLYSYGTFLKESEGTPFYNTISFKSYLKELSIKPFGDENSSSPAVTEFELFKEDAFNHIIVISDDNENFRYKYLPVYQPGDCSYFGSLDCDDDDDEHNLSYDEILDIVNNNSSNLNYFEKVVLGYDNNLTGFERYTNFNAIKENFENIDNNYDQLNIFNKTEAEAENEFERQLILKKNRISSWSQTDIFIENEYYTIDIYSSYITVRNNFIDGEWVNTGITDYFYDQMQGVLAKHNSDFTFYAIHGKEKEDVEDELITNISPEYKYLATKTGGTQP